MPATLLPREVGRLCPRRARAKPPAELLIAGVLALLQERRGGSGVFDVLAPIVPAEVAGHAWVIQSEAQPIRGGGARQGVTGRVRRDARTVGLEGQTPLPGGSALRPGGHSKRLQRPRRHTRPRFVPYLARLVLGFPVPAPLGHRLQPLSGGGMQGAAVWQRETREARRGDRAHAVFPPAFCMPRAAMARSNGTAVGGGAGQRLRIAYIYDVY